MKQMFTEEEEEEIDGAYQMKKQQLNEELQAKKTVESVKKSTPFAPTELKADRDGFKVPVRRIKRSKQNDEVIRRVAEKPSA